LYEIGEDVFGNSVHPPSSDFYNCLNVLGSDLMDFADDLGITYSLDHDGDISPEEQSDDVVHGANLLLGLLTPPPLSRQKTTLSSSPIKKKGRFSVNPFEVRGVDLASDSTYIPSRGDFSMEMEDIESCD